MCKDETPLKSPKSKYVGSLVGHAPIQLQPQLFPMSDAIISYCKPFKQKLNLIGQRVSLDWQFHPSRVEHVWRTIQQAQVRRINQMGKSPIVTDRILSRGITLETMSKRVRITKFYHAICVGRSCCRQFFTAVTQFYYNTSNRKLRAWPLPYQPVPNKIIPHLSKLTNYYLLQSHILCPNRPNCINGLYPRIGPQSSQQEIYC